jgi:hypothetical protein
LGWQIVDQSMLWLEVLQVSTPNFRLLQKGVNVINDAYFGQFGPLLQQKHY